MPYFQGSHGARLHYTDWGDGPPIVFGHGWSLGADAWEYQIPDLVARGFRCVAFDRRGCGRSDHTSGGYDFDTFADDLAALLAHLDLEHATIVAHSMAAGETVRMVTRHGTGRVSRLILVAPITPCLMRRPDNPEGIDGELFDAMIAGLVADRPGWMRVGADLFFGRNLDSTAVEASIVDWGIGLIMRSSAQATIEMVRAWSQADFRPDVERVTVPTLVIHGDADQIAPIAITGRRTAASLDDARLVVYEAGSHGLFVTHRSRLNDDIAAFAAPSWRPPQPSASEHRSRP